MYIPTYCFGCSSRKRNPGIFYLNTYNCVWLFIVFKAVDKHNWFTCTFLEINWFVLNSQKICDFVRLWSIWWLPNIFYSYACELCPRSHIILLGHWADLSSKDSWKRRWTGKSISDAWCWSDPDSHKGWIQESDWNLSLPSNRSWIWCCTGRGMLRHCCL